MYAPGCQNSWPPLECTDMKNLMLRYCSTSQTVFFVSGSDSFAGPWNVSSVQLVDAPNLAVEAGRRRGSCG